MTSPDLAATIASLDRPQPPSAVRKPRVEVRHGDRRVDDYFWMRDRENPEVAAYLEA
ncbi:MAG TPA: hypothetical protein VIC87_18570, partial [Vicinamibacteria bacterium]